MNVLTEPESGRGHGAGPQDAAPQTSPGGGPAQAGEVPTQDFAVEVLRWFAREGGLTLEVERAKEAWQRSGRAAMAREPWARLVEAAREVGLRAVLLERSPEDLLQLAEGGPLLTRGPEGWRIISGREGRLAVTRRAGQAEGLAEELPPAPDGLLRCALLHPLTPASGPADGHDHGHAGQPPLRRLLGLVRTDRRDIQTLLVFALVAGLLQLATPVAVEALVNTVAFVGLLQPIVVLALVLMACLGLAAAIHGLEAVVVELLQRRVLARVALDLAWRLPRVRREALDGAHGPELVNRFFDVPIVQKVGAKLLLDGVTAALSAAVGLAVLAFYHPFLLGFDLLLLGALALIVLPGGIGGVRTAIKESGAKYSVADWLEELARHPLAFQLRGGRELALDHADTLVNAYLDRRATHFRVVLRQLAMSLVLQVLASTLLLGLGGWLVTKGELTLGQLVASWLIVSVVLTSVAKLGGQLESVYDILASADKLGILFDLPLERQDGERCPAEGQGPAALRVRRLSFSWPGQSEPLLAGVELALAPGEHLAVVGPSGAGKTTLLELLHAQREPEAGQVELDGLTLRSLDLTSLRQTVALARRGEVVAGSVSRNLRLADGTLPVEALRLALEEVGLWSAIQSLPEGLSTELTSFGRPLSTSQADLLVLARVIAAKPRLLLVDGVLDGLDEAACSHLLERLASPQAPWTLVLATQRADLAARLGRQLHLPAGVLAPATKEEAA